MKYQHNLLWIVCVLLMVLLPWPALAQDPGELNTTYLPLLVKTGAPTPADPYTQVLNRVQQLCPAVGLNQVCYANGQVTLQPKSGEVPFSKPGAIADLANVKSLSLTSNGADSQQWGLALLRLRANSVTPDQDLTILAFGNVQISDIALFTGQGDEITLPSLHFASTPVAGVTKLGSSGLIVTNPTEEDLLSLTLNGAAITLGSTALVEAKPGDKMTVTMGTGVSLTEVSEESSAAIQSHQVSVPLGQNGKVSGPPAKARVINPLDEFFDKNLIIPITEGTLQKLGEVMLTSLNRAIDRCLNRQPAYVYNVLFWTRMIETMADVKERIDPAKLAQAYNLAPNCLHFEVDFDSTVTRTNSHLSVSSHLTATRLSMTFQADGKLLRGLAAPLRYVSYSAQLSSSCGPIVTETTPGQLDAIDGSLKIAVNKVRISTVTRVTTQPADTAIMNCPWPAPPLVIANHEWVTGFFGLHEDLWLKPTPSFHFKAWKYTAASSVCDEPASSRPCEHFGEAIYERTRTEGGFTLNGTTYLIMIHKPQK